MSSEKTVGGRAGDVARWIVAAIMVAIFAAVALGAIRAGVDTISTAYARPRPELRCDARRLHDCVDITRGVVSFQKPDSGDLVVTYNDGTDTLELSLHGDRVPEAGTRLELESWHGRYVSLYDPVAERRYRTLEWPGRGSDVGDGVPEILFGVVFHGPVDPLDLRWSEVVAPARSRTSTWIGLKAQLQATRSSVSG